MGNEHPKPGPYSFSEAVKLAKESPGQPFAFKDITWPGGTGNLSWDPNANNGTGSIILHPLNPQVRQHSGSVLSVSRSGTGEEINTDKEECGQNN